MRLDHAVTSECAQGRNGTGAHDRRLDVLGMQQALNGTGGWELHLCACVAEHLDQRSDRPRLDKRYLVRKILLSQVPDRVQHDGFDLALGRVPSLV